MGALRVQKVRAVPLSRRTGQAHEVAGHEPLTRSPTTGKPFWLERSPHYRCLSRPLLFELSSRLESDTDRSSPGGERQEEAGA